MIKTTAHVVKVGKDIDLILLGRIDYAKLIDKIAEAYIRDIQDKTYAAVYGASAKLPQTDLWIGTGALGSATKDKFDAIIEAVGAANNSNVIIMGTKSALKQITKLADVDWASASQKESIADSGRLGSYEGTTLIEVPQRFKIGGTEMRSDQYLVDNKMLLILPTTDNKFVKFVDEGDTEIFEVTNKADNMDDFNTHEVKRVYGSEVVLGNYFGKWTLA